MSVSQAVISQQVGVSRTAVSHVLNGRGYMVSEETRKRIMQAVEANGYHRNALVKALKSNRTHVIGIIVPELKVSFFGEVVRAAEKEARTHGLQCFLCQSHSSSHDLEKDIAALREYRVDGLLIAPSNSTEGQHVYDLLLQHKFPFVLVDTQVDRVKASSVINNNVEIGRLATQHLIDLGHRKIACFRGYPGACADQRYEGYCKALKKAGVPLDPELAVGDNYTFESGVEGVRSLLKKKTKFTGLVAASDYVALGAIQELAKNRLRVPEDVSVVGCANLDISEMITPSLTTVDQLPSQVGELAVRMLLEQIEEVSTPREVVRIKPKLIVRETTRAVK